jgi:hypothetical protein
MKKIIRWLVGPAAMGMYRDMKNKTFNRSKIYLCDPVTIGVVALMAVAATSTTVAIANSGDKKKPGGAPAPAPAATDIGNVGDVGSVDNQAAQRRLARLSKYFTSPTGVMDGSTGSAGVF